MNRIEVNVQTGERKVIELTPEEEKELVARAAIEAAKPAPTPRTVAQKLAPLGLTIEELKAELAK